MTPTKHDHETPQDELLRLVRALAEPGVPRVCQERHEAALSPKAIVGAFKVHPIVQVVLWLAVAAGSAVMGLLGYTWQLADKVDGKAAVLEAEHLQFAEVVKDLKGLPAQVRLLDHKVEQLKNAGGS